MVAQTCDRAAAISGRIGERIESKVQELYLKALFVHYLNLVLLQAASNLKNFKLFFQTLTGLGIFQQIFKMI